MRSRQPTPKRHGRTALAALLAAALVALACGGDGRPAEESEPLAAREAPAAAEPAPPVQSDEQASADGAAERPYDDLALPPPDGLDAQAAEQELDRRERELAERERLLAERDRQREERQREERQAAASAAERAAREAEREADRAADAVRRREERTAAEERAEQEAAEERAERAGQEELPAEPDRRADLEPEPEPEPLPRVVRVAAGTSFDVEFRDTLSSQTSEVGDLFRARITADVYEDGVLAIPRGSEVVGSVTQVQPTRRVGGRAVLGLRFTDLVLPTGEAVPLAASLVAEGQSETGRDAATIGGGAAAGAILGRILNKGDKSRGAILGAILGAAAGTAVAARTPGEEVTLPEGAVVGLRLDDELEVRRRRR